MPRRAWLTEVEKREIAAKYQTGKYSVQDLAREYNAPHASIIRRMKSLGVSTGGEGVKHRRKYLLDESYFSSIDERSAYWFGWLISDGNICKTQTTVKLSIQSGDIRILEEFKKDLGLDRPIRIFQPKNPTHKEMACLAFNSKKIYNNLINLGLMPNKSLIIRFPKERKIPKHLQKHVIRGIFDGDGYAGVMKRKNGKTILIASITGTKWICHSIAKIAKRELNITCSVNKSHIKTGNYITRTVTFAQNMARKFLSWLYEDASVWLDRKYEKFQLASIAMDAEKKPLIHGFGEYKSANSWLKDKRLFGTSRIYFKKWIANGKSVEGLVDEISKRKIYAFGEHKTVLGWSNDPRCYGISRYVLKNKIEKYGSVELAVQKYKEEKGALLIMAFGESKLVKDWAKDSRCPGLTATMISKRISSGFEPERAITQPSYALIRAFGELKNLGQWAKDDRCKIGYLALKNRIEDGWDVELAISTGRQSKWSYKEQNAKATSPNPGPEPSQPIE